LRVLLDDEKDSRLTGWEMLRESAGLVKSMAEKTEKNRLIFSIMIAGMSLLGGSGLLFSFMVS